MLTKSSTSTRLCKNLEHAVTRENLQIRPCMCYRRPTAGHDYLTPSKPEPAPNGRHPTTPLGLMHIPSQLSCLHLLTAAHNGTTTGSSLCTAHRAFNELSTDSPRSRSSHGTVQCKVLYTSGAACLSASAPVATARISNINLRATCELHGRRPTQPRLSCSSLINMSPPQVDAVSQVALLHK